MRREHIFLLLGFLLGLLALMVLWGLPSRAHGQSLKAGDVSYLHRVYPGGLNVEWAVVVTDDSPITAQSVGGAEADYTLTGVPLQPGHRIFFLNPAGEPSTGSAFVGPAVQGWNGISSNFALTFGGLTTATASVCDGNPADGVNLIKWGGLPSGVLAVACWYGGTECDSVMSTSYTIVDMKTVEEHEMGHCAGLGHSADPSALMYAVYHGPLSGPQADDIAGLCAIYGCVGTPTPSPTSTTPTPTATPTNTPTPTPTVGPWCPRPALPHCVVIPGIARDGPASEHAPWASQEVIEPASSGFQRIGGYWFDGWRWRDQDGNHWLADRDVWWDGGLYYWEGGEWLDGAGHPYGWVEPVALVTAQGGVDVLALIAQYPWPFDEAVAVAKCESGLNPNATNPSGAVGLFQIHPYNPANFDPATNVAAAYAKYLDGVSQGNRWAHWNRHGSCGHFF